MPSFTMYNLFAQKLQNSLYIATSYLLILNEKEISFAEGMTQGVPASIPIYVIAIILHMMVVLEVINNLPLIKTETNITR